MKINQIIVAIALFAMVTSYGQQTFTSKLLDQSTDKPIPFATIQFNSKAGVISNDNGEFNITIKRAVVETDSLMISCLGYEEKRIPLLSFNDSPIYLKSKSVDLSEVLVTNKNYTIDKLKMGHSVHRPSKSDFFCKVRIYLHKILGRVMG